MIHVDSFWLNLSLFSLLKTDTIGQRLILEKLSVVLLYNTYVSLHIWIIGGLAKLYLGL